MKPRQVFYDESQYANTPVRSYWEHTAGSPVPPFESLSGGASYEVAIIGGGYTGLSIEAGFGLHPLKLARGLAGSASRHGAVLYPHDVPISHYWRGLVCVTRKVTPRVGRDVADPTVYCGFGYHANGVNTAPWAGRQIAEMIARGDDGADRIPAICRGMPQKLPLAGLRLWYLRSAYQYYRFADAVL